MGKGKGSVDHWVAVVKPGRIMFEIAGVPEDVAQRGTAPGSLQVARSVRKLFHGRILSNG